MIIDKPGVYPDMDDATYHADPVAGGSLSSTGAKRILESPARFFWDATHRVEKTAFDIGHAVHALVLGVGMDVVEIPDELLASNGATSTKAAKEFIEATRAAGKVPLKAEVVAPIKAMADAVLTHPLARALFEKPGVSEASLFAPDPESGVWLRARPDRLPDQGAGRTIVTDLKTARSANPREFNRSAADFGYDVQRALYTHALRLARGDEDAAFVFVVVEVDAPHLVSVIELDEDFTAIGRARMRRAIDTYKTCRETGEWPGYPPVVHSIEAPRWLAYQEEGAA